MAKKRLVEMFFGLVECPHLGEAEVPEIGGAEATDEDGPGMEVKLDGWEHSAVIEALTKMKSKADASDKQKYETLLDKLGAVRF